MLTKTNLKVIKYIETNISLGKMYCLPTLSNHSFGKMYCLPTLSNHSFKLTIAVASVSEIAQNS